MSVLFYTKKYKKELILGPFFKLLEAAFELSLPILMAKLIDDGIMKGNKEVIYSMSFYMLLCTVLGLMCVLTCQYYSSVASQGFGTDLRRAVVDKILSFSHTELSHFNTDTLLTRTTNDINQLQLCLAMFIRLVIRAPFLSIGSIVMAFVISPKMGILFLLSVPLFAIILYLLMTKTVPRYHRVQRGLDKLNTIVREQLSGVRVIRSFNQEYKMEEKTDRVSENVSSSYISMTKLSALLSPVTVFMMNLVILLILWLGAGDIRTGSLETGQIIALINYMIQLLAALIVVSNLVTIFTRGLSSKKRVEEIFDTTPHVETINSTKRLDFSTEQVLSYKNVSFTYPHMNKPAIKNISFSSNVGNQIGVVGPTGSGKTTLVELIPKFYLPTLGEVYVDKISTKDYSTGILRNSISYVSQKSVLFAGTIRDNLCIGVDNVSDEKCFEALEIASCTDFIHSLDQVVVEHGNNFSGGQKQRLSIARGLIKEPDILILDDVLSALDYHTDALIRKRLKNLSYLKSSVIVSQRISSVEQSDLIIVLDKGAVVASGTHSSLLKNSEFYQNLVLSQKEEN